MDAPSFVSILPNLSIGVVSILGLVYVVIRFLQALDDRADKHEVAMTKREEAMRNLESDVRRNLTDQLAKNPIVTPVVKAGEQVVWKTDVFHHTNGKLVEISRAIEDGYLINLPDTSYRSEYGRRTFNNSSVTVPSFTPPGTYHIAIYNKVYVNPLRVITVKRVTEDFKVVR